MSKFYVYAAMHQGSIVYVGKGTSNRWKHCTSGKSTSYYLNFLHFQGEDVTVKIICPNLTEATANKVEQELIYRISPQGNSQHPSFLSYDAEAEEELLLQGLTIDKLLTLNHTFYFADSPTVDSKTEGWCDTHYRVFPNNESFIPFKNRFSPLRRTTTKRYFVPEAD